MKRALHYAAQRKAARRARRRRRHAFSVEWLLHPDRTFLDIFGSRDYFGGERPAWLPTMTPLHDDIVQMLLDGAKPGTPSADFDTSASNGLRAAFRESFRVDEP